MQNDFLKSLIQLLAQHGGTFTCMLAELQPLGLELSVHDFGGSAATLTLRLGARIYYVPAAPANGTTPYAPNTSEAKAWQGTMNRLQEWGRTMQESESQMKEPSSNSRQELESEFPEVESLEEETEEIPLPEELQEVQLPRPSQKSDLDLYLLEQRQTQTQTTISEAREREARNAARQLPWETRDSPPPRERVLPPPGPRRNR